MPEAWEREEELMYNQIAFACAAVQHLEKQWDAEEFPKKISQYMRKAGKSTVNRGKWQGVIESFTNKFYELIGTACHDRDWLDQADWALPIASAIKAYSMSTAQTQSASSDEYLGYVGQCCSMAHDQARYFAGAWEYMKEVVPNKVALKKVREAVDEARANVVKQMQPNPEMFIAAWVSQATELLAAQSFRNNPKASLVTADAERLFDVLVQNGGIPMWLEAVAGKPSPGCHEVKAAVAAAYMPHPDMAPRAPKGFDKGFGKGKDDWGKGGYGKDAWGGACGGGYGQDAWGGGCGKGMYGKGPY